MTALVTHEARKAEAAPVDLDAQDAAPTVHDAPEATPTTAPTPGGQAQRAPIVAPDPEKAPQDAPDSTISDAADPLPYPQEIAEKKSTTPAIFLTGDVAEPEADAPPEKSQEKRT